MFRNHTLKTQRIPKLYRENEGRKGHNASVNGRNRTSLYTNIPQEEGINIVCKTYETFHLNKPPIPTLYLRDMLGLFLKENSFHFNGKNYLQTPGTAMGT